MKKDPRVRYAVDHYATRFVANGGDYYDFQRVTNRVDHWDDWCQTWSECGAMHEQLGDSAEAAQHFESAACHYVHAALAYHFGKFLFACYPRELRAAHDRTVSAYQRALPFLDFPGERVAIPYEGGARLYGILRTPHRRYDWCPVVILVPGLDSVKEELHQAGNDLLQRDMAVLAIDGPGQGEMEFEYPMRHDYEAVIRHAIDYLETRPELDAGRVGLLGIGLGGYYALRSTAYEPRVKATIAVAPVYDLVGDFDRLPRLIRDAFIARSGSTSVFQALAKLESFHLAGVMNKVRCPLLIIVGRTGDPAPAEDAAYLTEEAGEAAALWLFEEGNPTCDNIVYRQRPQRADWMHDQLYRLPPSQPWLP
ncbi:MAG TPA: alpha/beta hydrolase [Ktedonobacteraceae bacterium]|nr:alpha/beta hydrolase [Ktedonobacteraceae bacterium]